jgi:membrane-associated PAP2 superfamily phosphatase
VCTTAFHCGHLKTLKWAVANGCPWDAVACGGDAADCIRRLEQIGA